MKFLSNLLNLFVGFYLFYLLYLFLKWYIKGHFGKYFILFWAFTIYSIFVNIYVNQKIKKEWAPGYRATHPMWEEK